MRVLAVEPGPHFSVFDVHRGLVKALRRHVAVADVNLGARLDFYTQAVITEDHDRSPNAGEKRALSETAALKLASRTVLADAYEWWPDVVLVTSAMFTPPSLLDLLRSRGHLVVVVMTESPYEDERQLRVAEHADVVFVNDPTNLEQFRQVTTAHYLPHAYDPDVHRPVAPAADLACDVVLAGTGYPSRIEFLSQVDWDGVGLALAGNWKALPEGSPLRDRVIHDLDACWPNAESPALYAAARTGIEIYRREAMRPDLVDGWAMGPRDVEMAACGLFFLSEPRGELGEVLPDVPTFTGPGDYGEQLRWWLAHPDKAAAVADRNRARIAERTFDHNARTILRICDAKRPAARPA